MFKNISWKIFQKKIFQLHPLKDTEAMITIHDEDP